MKHWGFQREVIRPRPRLAFWILTIGAGIHFAACFPLFGRRGFPEYPPIYLAMQWLWVFPVALSAAWVPMTRKRLIGLIAYMLPTGFTISWALVFAVPSHKGPLAALITLPGVLPFYWFAVMFVEGISRAVLMALRTFPPSLACRKCGYPLHHLSRPECPECGQAFDATLMFLTPDDIRPARRPWRTRIFMVLVTALLFLFPPLYHQWHYHRERSSGRAWAEVEWRSNEAVWYVTQNELDSMTPAQAHRFMDLEFADGPEKGLRVDRMWTDWWHVHWQTAYRERIEELLEESGGSPPDFGPP